MTKIEWCDETINPISGCLNGCDFCYARKFAKRLAGNEQANPGSTGYPTEGDPFRPTFHPNKIDKILGLKGRGKRIFLDSMSDWFSAGVEREWIRQSVEAVAQKPEHTFLVLTKRPDRITYRFDLDNLWLGTSITCQNDVHRIQELKSSVSARTHKFVSVEPLYGSIETDFVGIEWVIIGAETGNRKGKIKPKVEWVGDLRKQAERLGVPVFLKNNLRSYCDPGNIRA